ncbi:hypothetical protein BC830DRAFT_1167776 [Chytriomyces sp. MP71]|nr:hypothetical protein BC830DRAFT_1167776 [Chytriomyces sp. MP71]
MPRVLTANASFLVWKLRGTRVSAMSRAFAYNRNEKASHPSPSVQSAMSSGLGSRRGRSELMMRVAQLERGMAVTNARVSALETAETRCDRVKKEAGPGWHAPPVRVRALADFVRALGIREYPAAVLEATGVHLVERIEERIRKEVFRNIVVEGTYAALKGPAATLVQEMEVHLPLVKPDGGVSPSFFDALFHAPPFLESKIARILNVEMNPSCMADTVGPGVMLVAFAADKGMDVFDVPEELDIAFHGMATIGQGKIIIDMENDYAPEFSNHPALCWVARALSDGPPKPVGWRIFPSEGPTHR